MEVHAHTHTVSTNAYYSQMNWSLINNKCKPALRQIEKLIPMLKKEYHLQ